ncbi:MAG: dienelactone hydrolase family protein [bacterium]
MKSIATLLLSLGLAGCAGPHVDPNARPEDFYHWRPTSAAVPCGWAVLLPGSTGLDLFGDTTHYFVAADSLNAWGYDALVVDYKPAYFASADAPDVPTGEKIAWVTRQAIAWMERTHPATQTRDGRIVAWSLGAEGAIRLVNDAETSRALRLRSVALFYPSNQKKLALTNHVPVLVLTGDADDVTRLDDVRTLAASRPESAPSVELVVMPGARHGFDIASLREKKTIRMLPLFGPKATLQYDAAAAARAWSELHGWAACD